MKKLIPFKNCKFDKDNFIAHIWSILGFTLCLIFFLYQYVQVFNKSTYYDDSLNANYARALADYSFNLGENQIVAKFSPDVTTGFPLIISTAILTQVFGHVYWVPGFTTVITTQLFFILIFVLLKKKYQISSLGKFMTFFFVILIGFSFEDLRNERLWPLRIWYQLLGEAPAALLAILGVLFLDLKTSPQHEVKPPALPPPLSQQLRPLWPSFGWDHFFVSGTLIGLAVCTKNLAFFVLPPMIFYLIKRKRIRQLFSFCMGFLIPMILWKAILFLTMGSKVFFEVTQTESSLFKTYSGIGNFVDKAQILDATLVNLNRNFTQLSHQFGGITFIVLFFILLFFTLVRSKNHIFEFEVRVLSIALLSHFLYWLFISPSGWSRHLMIAMIFATFIFGLFISEIRGFKFKNVFLFSVFLLIAPKLHAIKTGFVNPFFSGPEVKLQSLLSLEKELYRLKRQGKTLIGCGWWVPREVLYILDGKNNFKDCRTIDEKEFHRQNVVLVRDISYWNYDYIKTLESFQRNCERDPIWYSWPFIVSICNRPPDDLSFKTFGFDQKGETYL